MLLGSASVISDGMHYGWTAPTLPLLEQKNDSSIHITHEDHIWLETIYLIGSLVGIPITIYIVDRIGRKNTILLSALISLISWIIIALANNVILLYIARFVVGIASDASFVANPMYVAEIAAKNLRGFCAGIGYIMFLIGILIINTIAPLVPLYIPAIIGGGILSFQMVAFHFMPDSPYYLVAKGKEAKAKESLKKLRTEENVDNEMAEIVAAIKRQEAEKGRPQDLIIDKGNRKAVLILFVLNSAQHFSSISVILMNLQNIFIQADSIYMSAYTSGILFSGIMLLAAITADVVVDKFGRKILLTISSILSGIFLLLLAIYFTLQKEGFDVKPVSWIPIVTIMMYGFSFKLGLGIVPIMVTAELFPAKVKAMGMASADLFYCVAAWASIELYQRLSVSFGFDWPFYIFSACCFMSTIFTRFYIPETKGKSLEEIQFILKGISLPTTNVDTVTIEQTKL